MAQSKFCSGKCFIILQNGKNFLNFSAQIPIMYKTKPVEIEGNSTEHIFYPFSLEKNQLVTYILKTTK